MPLCFFWRAVYLTAQDITLREAGTVVVVQCYRVTVPTKEPWGKDQNVRSKVTRTLPDPSG